MLQFLNSFNRLLICLKVISKVLFFNITHNSEEIHKFIISAAVDLFD
jgi:hypothetical protein